MLDDGPSVDDVMRLYANGFGDDSDTEDIPNVSVDGHHFKHDKRNPSGSDVGGTPYPPPDVGNVGAKMLEAMSDMLPIPKATPTANSSPSVARDSVAMFRHSLPPSSLPQDGSLDLASLAISNKDEGALEPERSRHDSGKLVGADEEDSRTKQRSGSSDSTRQAAAEMEILSLSSSSSASAPSSSSTPGVQEAAPAASSQLPAAPIHAPMPQEPVEEPGSRDRYGFRKANAYITREQYDAWDKPYSEYLARRHKKWVAFLRENSLMTEQPNRFPQRSAKAKRFVRKGIPPNWRGAAWFYYAGGPAILAKHGGVYGHLVGRAGFDADTGDKVGEVESEVKPHVAEDIEKDLHRTFPDNVRFKPPLHAEADDSVSRSTGATPTEPSPRGFSTIGYVTEPKIIGSLRRVLYAFALYNPRIGYCQSLNFLAGLLLLFVESEEHAFWLLNVITRVYLPGTHETSLEGSKVDLGVLMESLKDSLPAVWKHIAAEDGMTGKRPKPKRGDRTPQGHDPNRLPAITLCMTAWFMSCFIGTLPIESVLRVWDVFFYEGSRTLFRISLAVFKLGEAEIRRCTDPMEMFTVVQALPRRLLDANALMEACYKRRNGIGHISQEAVEERRLEARTGIRRWKAEQEAAASGAPATPTTGATASGLDLAELPRSASEAVRRKGTLFGRRRERERDREQMRAAEVV